MIRTRQDIATHIINRLESEKVRIKEAYEDSRDAIGYFFVDDVLPEELVIAIHKAFPKTEDTMLKKSLREFKHVAAQMNQYNPLLEETIYAFQDERVVNFFKRTLNIESLYPDENLYAGGISLMAQNNFLNPHLDNSHDKDRNHWRVFNLLFYVTPDWEEHFGGNLEIWPNGPSDKPITIFSKFNRLAVMATHNKSWHSVSQIEVNGVRCCVSNYYFSENPLTQLDNFHVTTFRGRPDQKIRNAVLKVDAFLRSSLRKVFKKGIKKNPHVYKKTDEK